MLRVLFQVNTPNKQKAYNSKQKLMGFPWSPWLKSAYSTLNSIFLPSGVYQEESQPRLTCSNPLAQERWGKASERLLISICASASLAIVMELSNILHARGQKKDAPNTVRLRTKRSSAFSGPNHICENASKMGISTSMIKAGSESTNKCPSDYPSGWPSLKS